MKMLDHINEYDRTKASFSTWLYKLAQNYLLDMIRLNKIHRNILSLNNERVDNAAANSNHLLDAQLSQIEKLIGNRAYEIVILKLRFNMTFKEISDELDISVMKAKHIFYDSMKIIKNFMNRGSHYEEKVY